MANGIGSVIGADRPHSIVLPTGHVLTRVFGGNTIYIYDAATWRYGKDVSKAQRFEQSVTVGVWGPGWYTFNPAQKSDAKREAMRLQSAEIALARSQALSAARQEASGITATARPSDTRVSATARKTTGKASKAPKAAKPAKADSTPQDARGENERQVRPETVSAPVAESAIEVAAS